MHAIMEICLLRNLNINPVYHTKIGTELSMMVIFCQEYDILGFDGIYIYMLLGLNKQWDASQSHMVQWTHKFVNLQY